MGESPPLISGVDFLPISTRDLERAIDFYGEVLGLPCSVRYDRAPGAEFEAGGLTLQLVESEKIGREFRPNRNPPALHVDDVAAARAELEKKGVEFEGDILDSGVCHMAFFHDPDGNWLMLHHRYAPRNT